MSDPATIAKSVRTDQTPRTQPIPWRLVILVAGDAISFLIFAGAGRSSHGEASGPSAPLYVVGTALPFVAAWFAVSPFLGAFRRSAAATLGTMLQRTELAWLCAWPVAMLVRFVADRIRGLPLNSGFLTFAAVVLVTNAIFLGVWRGAFALASARLRPSGELRRV
jgi:hypothetical protein